MAQSVSRKRPWLAAVLAAVVTGLGHLYLRRWRRALGWLAVSLGVTALFTDPAALEEFRTGSWTLDALLSIAPMVIVIGFSIVDAYLLAQIQNADARSTESPDRDPVSCPHCGNDFDPDLEFCHWCTKSVDGTDRDRREI
ncbi:DUF7575 domain-containing protein [Natrinema amylolyticum]|uniref:DUF7575 domain-containing protein n=1 Tax=Natrinema amylolyticum TaxID=2878679 RepID=UPI001CFA18F7|nr:zinc ribbon domain-containing protein [Natrinema amylolyticum]